MMQAQRSLPIFAEGPSNVVKRLPYIGFDATLQGFMFQSNRSILQSVCDQMINAPTKGAVTFRAVSSHVFLTALYQPRVQSDDPIDRTTGYVEEIDLAFWILVFGGRSDDMLGWRLRWLPVWLFVDTGSAIAAGREVFGYPKHQASFTKAIDSAPDDASVTVSTLAFVRSGPDERAQQWPLISLEAVDPHAKQVPAKPTLLHEVTDALRQLLGGRSDTLGRTSDILENLALPFVNMPMIFLKQFRDVHSPGRACFQAVTTVPVESRHIDRIGFFPTAYRLNIKKAKSHPIEEVLGLKSGQESVFGFWLIQDFYVGFGETLWEA
jgi:hypothetical protein